MAAGELQSLGIIDAESRHCPGMKGVGGFGNLWTDSFAKKSSSSPFLSEHGNPRGRCASSPLICAIQGRWALFQRPYRYNRRGHLQTDLLTNCLCKV
jgi:hypothetical protein